MSVTIHEKKALSSLPTLATLGINYPTDDNSPDSEDGVSLRGPNIHKENAIRNHLALDPKFEVWAPLVYYWTNGVVLNTDTVMVSIKGALAYGVDGDLHINYGDLESGNPQASITILGDQHTLQIGRAVASTFLTLPDVYKDIDRADLQVIHLDGQAHQCHFLNLEWKLNKTEAETDLIEKTVKVLNADLPTEE